jgi:two-component system chemotaxis sensor kinase CheA
MLLRVGAQRFLLPVASMVEALRPAPADIRTVLGKGRMIESRGQLLPLIGLDRVFGIESKDSGGMAIVVDVLGGRLALGADDVIGQQQVVIKPLAGGLGHHAGIAGSAILGDGRVALLIDPSRLTNGAST